MPSFTNEKTDKKVILAYYAWRRIEHQTSDGYTFGEAYFDTDDLKDVFHNVTGVGFMKSMIAYFERQRMYKNSGPKFGAEYVTGGQRTYVKLKWEGEELVTDNKVIIQISFSHIPALHFNAKFAVKWAGSNKMKRPRYTNWDLTYRRIFLTIKFPTVVSSMTYMTRTEILVFGRSARMDI